MDALEGNKPARANVFIITLYKQKRTHTVRPHTIDMTQRVKIYSEINGDTN